MPFESDSLGPSPSTQAMLRLIPRFGEVAATWRTETFERQERRAELLGDVASEQLGAEQFFAQVAGDERLTDMFNAAVEAAIATSSDAKIRLLGRALATGSVASDQARVDEAEQLLRIAVEIDPIDLRALRSLESWTVSDPVSAVAFALEISPAIAGAIVSRAERLHLISVERTAMIYDKSSPDDDQVQIDEEWSLTATSEALFELLVDESAHQADGVPLAPGSRWAGFTADQARLLQRLFEGHLHEWRLTPSPAERTAKILTRLDLAGVSRGQIRKLMRGLGVEKSKLDLLDRWF